MTSKKSTDWLGIETEYRGTKTPVLQIAKTYGVTEGAIRARAKKEGWVRDNGKLKRALVDSKLAGITKNSTNYEVRNLIEQGAEQDAADMRDGLAVARSSIKKLLVLIDGCEDPKEIKVVVEANKIAIETIRRIRGLDESVNTGETLESLLEKIDG